MDEFTNLHPVPQRTEDEHRAAAGLRDVSRAASRERGTKTQGAGRGAGLLAGIERRAARHHRRRVTGAAAVVAAVAAAGLVVPVVVPGGAGQIMAALGLDGQDSAPAPSPTPDASTPPVDEQPVSAASMVGDALVLTDDQVEAFVAGVQGRPAGALRTDNARYLRDSGLSDSLTTGGWCREVALVTKTTATQEGTGKTEMITVSPGGTWSATWRAGAPSRPGVEVDEKAVKWSSGKVYPGDVETARSYVEVTGDSSTTCNDSAGQGLAGDFQVLPAPLPGAVQAAAPLQVEPGTWQVRTVASAAGSGTAVDLTVVLPAPSAQQAGQAVIPLLRQALERVTAWDAVSEAAAGAGTAPQAGPASTAPGRVVVRPYNLLGQVLTLNQVGAVLPGATLAPQPDLASKAGGRACMGPFGLSEGYENSSGSEAAAFETTLDGAPASVKEWLMHWSANGSSTRSPLFAANSPCRSATTGEPWEAVTLTHAGVDVPAVVSHPGGDPRRWVVLATAAAEPAVAVGLQVQMSAASQDEVAAVVVPLLQGAQQRAYDANFVQVAP